jgi:hypothetical protein
MIDLDIKMELDNKEPSSVTHELFNVGYNIQPEYITIPVLELFV